jgi:hypothetical protein
MNAAARVAESVVVAGRGDLIRGGRGREGRGCAIGAPRCEFSSSHPRGNMSQNSNGALWSGPAEAPG